MLTMIRAAIGKLKEAIKPPGVRHVEDLAREIRLDNERLLAECRGGACPVAPDSPAAGGGNGKTKKKEDPSGSFRPSPS